MESNDYLYTLHRTAKERNAKEKLVATVAAAEAVAGERQQQEQ